ncbi:MAG: hypothetical protein ACKOSS_03750 [Planctomycetia bacterium]
MRAPALPACLLLALVGLLALRAPGLAADGAEPVVAYAPGGSTRLEGQGAQVVLAAQAGRQAALVDVQGGSAWARVFVRGLKVDLRPLQHLDLELKAVNGAVQELRVKLLDAKDREATARLDAPKAEWETRRLDLGDLSTDPGFAPELVTTVQLVWMKPVAQVVAVGRLAFVPGPAGWRHPPEEQARRVFGPQRAKDVKGESSAHVAAWSDDPRALKGVLAALEADISAFAQAFALAPEALEGLRLPAYVFKQASDYQDYCVRVLGWTKEQARRTPAAGSEEGLVLYVKGVEDAQLQHRVAKAVFSHGYGLGGGAWLQDGAGEYGVRRRADRPVTKELASRLKTGETWTLADLVQASTLHGGERTDASFDYRPIYLHAASVLEWLLREAPAGGDAAEAPAERIRERLKRLAAIREQGKERVEKVVEVLGEPLESVEAAYKAWAARAR